MPRLSRQQFFWGVQPLKAKRIRGAGERAGHEARGAAAAAALRPPHPGPRLDDEARGAPGAPGRVGSDKHPRANGAKKRPVRGETGRGPLGLRLSLDVLVLAGWRR